MNRPIHDAGIKLLEDNSDYEFEIVENTDNEFLKSKSFICLFRLNSLLFKSFKICFFSKDEISPLWPDKRLKKKYNIKKVEINKK